MQIAVLGDGGWGTAVAMMLHFQGYSVRVWGPFKEYVEQVAGEGINARYLPGVALPPTLEWCSSEAEAVAGAEVVVLAAPSRYFRGVCRRFAGLITREMVVVSLTKGLCEESHARMSEVAEQELGIEGVVVLSGPSHAEEVARGIPTAVVAACGDEERALQVQQIFSTPVFRVYTTGDVLGVELGGAVKNVVAVAVGASDGLGFGDNTKAALITRGLAEVTRFGVALGARPETFAGLSGVGDLIVTCTSTHSRNYTVGKRLGRGERIESILESMQMVAEGVWNAKVVYEVGSGAGVEMPLTEAVYGLCYQGQDVRRVVESLMGREYKSEG